MDKVTYRPPLRSTVLWIVGLRKGAVDHDTIAEIAQVPPDRAKAFMSILIAMDAVTKTNIGYIAGPKWEEYSILSFRSRPRTTSASAKEEIEIVKNTISQRLTKEIQKKKMTIRGMAKLCGVPHHSILNLLRYGDVPPAWHLVMISRVIGKSVEELATPL